MSTIDSRKIPFNYTSADDHQVLRLLLGDEGHARLQRSRLLKTAGQALHPLMRFLGDMFILWRNPFIRNDLIADPRHHHRFFETIRTDVERVKQSVTDNPEMEAVVADCLRLFEETDAAIERLRKDRELIHRVAAPVVGKKNIFTDPFTLNAHVTDATNWRFYQPLAVVRPTGEAQVAPLIDVLNKNGFNIIPRGGGTGLTGGSVPLDNRCVIINTERLNRIHGIETCEIEDEDGSCRSASVIHLESGVITEAAMAVAKRQGLVFATDPTSAWACTIGGNIAENAGGKKAVLWGTAIDNLLSYTIAMPDGRLYSVNRRRHTLGRILPDDALHFDVLDDAGIVVRQVSLSGLDIRKKGLGKDITNKALSGLPGIQKEGTDGIITSARFVLHNAYPEKVTCCLEFFGSDMDEASRAIAAICEAFENRGEEALMALEHFDDAYVRAIGYKVKAPRQDLPKAVLLIDVVGHRSSQVRRGIERLEELLAAYSNTHLFVAEDEPEAERFWRDRKRLGAIAARTESFKLNEDIVLPISALAEFARFADDINAEEQRENQLDLVFRLGTHLETAQPLEDPEWMAAKRPAAKALFMEALDRIRLAGTHHLQEETHIRRLKEELNELFSGYVKINREIEEIYADTRSRLIVIATHMHAGDGNIHVNIPVFSNDREMMIRAAETADLVMARAVELGGVVSGEHGIGFTKFKYLDKDRVSELQKYRREVDPNGTMNPGKLDDGRASELVFAPSFNLLELEAGILRYGELEALAERISGCVRCGRCKTPCCVFHPKENLFYHPRNKNLAVTALIEAILYETQRFRSTEFAALKYLGQVADHCTICHKCQPPCPVDIDTGAVSVLERKILTDHHFRKTPTATKIALTYLDSRSPVLNAVMRGAVMRTGTRIQRAGSWLFHHLPIPQRLSDAKTLMLLQTPMPSIPAGTLFGTPLFCGVDQVVVIEPEGSAKGTLFYFPGCGSERLFSNVSMAAVHILHRTGIRVVLPPPFLCCGFPAGVNAKKEMKKRQSIRTAVILNQIKERFGNWRFDAIGVTCGTCRESLIETNVESIFRCQISDVSRFVLECGLTANIAPERLYHTPCHDSLSGTGKRMISALGGKVTGIPHCCGEAGTLALSRPDISAAMRSRKRDVLQFATNDASNEKIVLTNCPSCLTGLGRLDVPGIKVRHLAEELAIAIDGETWLKKSGNWRQRSRAFDL